MSHTPITADGWEYVLWRDDKPAEKRHHSARKGGKEKSLDHWPFDEMTHEAFAAHVFIGFASFPGNRPWRTEEIVAYAKANGMPA